MSDQEDAVRNAVENKHYVRALHLATAAGWTQMQIEDIRNKALWQVSAIFRNAAGTRILAKEQGLPKNDVEGYLRKRAEEERSLGQVKSLEPTFDQHTKKYLTFEEWLDNLIRRWDKIPSGS